jgi:hypothetical protein
MGMSNHKPNLNPSNAPDPGVKHEDRDMDVKAVLGFGVALSLGLVVVHFICVGVYHWLAVRPEGDHASSPLASTRQTYSGPRLLVNQAQDMDDLRAKEDALLDHYGWVDRGHGVVRIPIDRAMELLAQHGNKTNAVLSGAQP